MSYSNAPKLLLRYAKAALKQRLGLSDTQVAIASAPYVDPAWADYPHYLVVPGAARPDGGGVGAQAGGALIRRQAFAVHCYVRLSLDPHEGAEQLLARDDEGLADVRERVREAFELTYFGDGAGSYLTLEAVRWEGEPAPRVVDPENHVVSGAVEFSAPIKVSRPTAAVTISLADAADQS